MTAPATKSGTSESKQQQSKGRKRSKLGRSFCYVHVFVHPVALCLCWRKLTASEVMRFVQHRYATSAEQQQGEAAARMHRSVADCVFPLHGATRLFRQDEAAGAAADGDNGQNARTLTLVNPAEAPLSSSGTGSAAAAAASAATGNSNISVTPQSSFDGRILIHIGDEFYEDEPPAQQHQEDDKDKEVIIECHDDNDGAAAAAVAGIDVLCGSFSGVPVLLPLGGLPAFQEEQYAMHVDNSARVNVSVVPNTPLFRVLSAHAAQFRDAMPAPLMQQQQQSVCIADTRGAAPPQTLDNIVLLEADSSEQTTLWSLALEHVLEAMGSRKAQLFTTTTT
jgi:hypothetical protein